MSFKRLDPEDFVFSATNVVAPAWISNNSTFSAPYYTTNKTPDQENYYLNIYAYNTNLNPGLPDGIEFAIAYGDKEGSGSFWYSPSSPNLTPSRTIYGQFINLLFGEDENNFFNFGSFNDSSFLAIVINRSSYKQAIFPGSLQIRGPYPDDVYVTDNSRITTAEYTPAGRRYMLGSGSFGDGVTPSSLGSLGIYGYLYPDVGIIILNPLAFDIAKLADPTYPIFVRGNNVNSNNPQRLRFYLQSFTLLSEETIPSNFIFCRARNAEFNYSTNPSFEKSFYSSSLNEYMQTPATYITSVGLYNDNNELLAVAKLSKPLKKEFDTEALIRVKLDF
jgi:hypothetical protein